MTLAELIPAGAPQGAGIVARHEGRLVFLGEPAPLWGGILACVRVGGMCKQQESWPDCARREAVEELGCEVGLVSSPQTYLARGGVTPRPVDIQDDPRPLLVYARAFLSGGGGPYWNVLYMSSLAAPPRLVPGTHVLLLLSDNALFALAQQPLTISALRDAGALIESTDELPPDAQIRAEPAANLLAHLLKAGVRIPPDSPV